MSLVLMIGVNLLVPLFSCFLPSTMPCL
uniref:Uncharacterized protein n=1 Tax=Arundo donax TaxID=35708 RepID=A0A0A8YQG6_ARUDO